MSASPAYIAVLLIALAIVALLVFIVRRNVRETKLTPVAGLAFGFVLAGIFFGEERLIGYGLLGAGILLAVIDIIKKSREGKKAGPTSTTPG
jgi:predicted branched-subunit amino acid permease